ncbi:hypothetical protein D3C84_951160 [compost metagenome]
MGVLANELADLVHQEHDALILAALIQVLLHPFGEAFDVEAEVVFKTFHPSIGILDFLPKSFRQGRSQRINLEMVGVALIFPSGA